MLASAIVTAGFKWPPETRPTANTAIATENAQPAVMQIQPPPLPLVFERTIFATTPFPKRMSKAVPTTSARKTFMRTGFLGVVRRKHAERKALETIAAAATILLCVRAKRRVQKRTTRYRRHR